VITKSVSRSQVSFAYPQVFFALVLAFAVLLVQAAGLRAQGIPNSFADLAEKVSPAVVNITTSVVVASPVDQLPMVPEGSPFEDFFKDFQDRQKNGPENRQRRGQALGSGFVISKDGYIVTNNHVVQDADEIEVEFFSGIRLPATVVGTDRNTDIAVLKVESDEPLPFVSFGDSDTMRVGDWVLAVGNPLGQGFSVSAGIISARNRELSGAYDDFIQTDAAINQGNSGGPLFNLDGQVVGVNTAILSPNGGSIGIGFSMASNVVGKVVSQLTEFGETRRGWLGVSIQNVTSDVAEAIGMDEPSGALVTDVFDGPSKVAGLQPGDVIVRVDETDVADTRTLVRVVGDSAVGKTVEVTVFRDGEKMTFDVTLGRREDAEAARASAQQAEPGQGDILGMMLSEMTDEMRDQMGLGQTAYGLVVMAVEDGSQAQTKGVLPGDIITEAGQQKLETLSDLEDRIAEAQDAGRRSILLLVRRDGEPRFVALGIENE